MAIAKITKTDEGILKHRKKLLEGYMLAVDPSTGSGSSMPGYAIYKAGTLIESGTIEVSPSLPKNRRLYEIRRTLECDFDVPDVLVIEHISSIPFGNLRFNADALAGLLRGVGAILSAFDIDAVVEIPPKVWKTTVDEDYVKSDEADAVYMGRHAILRARGDQYIDKAKEFNASKRKVVRGGKAKTKQSKATVQRGRSGTRRATRKSR